MSNSVFYVNVVNDGICENVYDMETNTIIRVIPVKKNDGCATSFVDAVKTGMSLTSDEVELVSDSANIVYGHSLRTMGYTDIRIACYSVR